MGDEELFTTWQYMNVRFGENKPQTNSHKQSGRGISYLFGFKSAETVCRPIGGIPIKNFKKGVDKL